MIRAILSGALLITLAACVHKPSIFDGDTPAPVGADEKRSEVDWASLTPEERAAFVAQLVRDSAFLDAKGFLQRQSSVDDAYFVTPEDIAQIKPQTISDIFRHVPVLLERVGPAGTRPRGNQGCFITYVNGMVRNTRFLSELETFIPVREVVAAEVYPPGQSPPPPFVRSGSRSDCTTVGLWTRS